MKYDFEKIINEKHPNIELLDKYVDKNTDVMCHCKICNVEWVAKPRTIRNRGCLKCAGSVTRRISDDEYKEKLFEVHGNKIESLEPYKNMNTKILHKCIFHNNEFYAQPAKILSGQGCRLCGLEKIGDAKRDNIDNLKDKIFKKYGNEFELLSTDYKNNSTKMLFRHNCETPHTFYASANHLLNNGGCGVCHGLQVCEGYNDIATTNSYVASLFEDYEESKRYTEWSCQSVNFKCPNCGHIRKKMISQVSRDGDLSCPVCGDGYSYPNKFMYNSLLQIKDKLDFLSREFSPDWCTFLFRGMAKTGKYDIYFGISGNKYIIEMDGGLGHGNKVIGNISREESLYIDAEKDKLAIQNGIKVIRINCEYGRDNRFEYIISNLYKSELQNILPLNLIDFTIVDKHSQSSLLIYACNMWNEGFKASDIVEKLDIVSSTVTNYLQKGNEIGLCKNYSSEQSMKRSHGNKIICLTYNKIFLSIVDASNYYNIGVSSISKCCRGKISYGGKLKDGTKLRWMYYEDYLESTAS